MRTILTVRFDDTHDPMARSRRAIAIASRNAVKETPSRSHYFYLQEVYEPHCNELAVVLVEATSEGQNIQSIPGSKIEATPVVPVSGIAPLELHWSSYIAYSVRNESYAKDCGLSVASSGVLIEKTASPFLEFVAQSTIATTDYPGPFRHWQVNCVDHIVDVVSTADPVTRASSRPAEEW